MDFVFSFLVEDDTTKALKVEQLDFEIPTNFLNPQKFRPTVINDDMFGDVPDYVCQGLFESIEPDVPIDPLTPFVYLRQGRLPHYVVIYFMKLQGSGRNLGAQKRFFRAMHLIEAYREFVTIPPVHFLAGQPLDTASVQPKDGNQVTTDTEEKKEAGNNEKEAGNNEKEAGNKEKDSDTDHKEKSSGSSSSWTELHWETNFRVLLLFILLLCLADQINVMYVCLFWDGKRLILFLSSIFEPTIYRIVYQFMQKSRIVWKGKK